MLFSSKKLLYFYYYLGTILSLTKHVALFDKSIFAYIFIQPKHFYPWTFYSDTYLYTFWRIYIYRCLQRHGTIAIKREVSLYQRLSEDILYSYSRYFSIDNIQNVFVFFLFFHVFRVCFFNIFCNRLQNILNAFSSLPFLQIDMNSWK